MKKSTIIKTVIAAAFTLYMTLSWGAFITDWKESGVNYDKENVCIANLVNTGIPRSKIMRVPNTGTCVIKK